MKQAEVKAYYDALRQKQDALPRIAGRLGSSEIERLYLEIARAKQRFLQSIKPRLSSSTMREQAIAFCASLPATLLPALFDVCRFATYHAFSDIAEKEIDILSEVGQEDIDELTDSTLSASLKTVSSESRITTLISFATRLAVLLEEGVAEHSGVSIDECLAMIGHRLDSFLANLRRIVFTELCSAYNFTQLLCYNELFGKNEKYYIRWCERINDKTGKPLHGAVSADSIAMHGQITRPQDYFHGPDGKWFHPPNRPYDHAVLMFWHPNLREVPAWNHATKKEK